MAGFHTYSFPAGEDKRGQLAVAARKRRTAAADADGDGVEVVGVRCRRLRGPGHMTGGYCCYFGVAVVVGELLMFAGHEMVVLQVAERCPPQRVVVSDGPRNWEHPVQWMGGWSSGDPEACHCSTRKCCADSAADDCGDGPLRENSGMGSSLLWGAQLRHGLRKKMLL